MTTPATVAGEALRRRRQAARTSRRGRHLRAANSSTCPPSRPQDEAGPAPRAGAGRGHARGAGRLPVWSRRSRWRGAWRLPRRWGQRAARRRHGRRPTGQRSAKLREEPAVDPGRDRDLRLGNAPAKQGEDAPEAVVRRGEETAQYDRRGGALGMAGGFARLAALVDPADPRVGQILGVRAHAAEDRGEVLDGTGPRGPRGGLRRLAPGRGAPC